MIMSSGKGQYFTIWDMATRLELASKQGGFVTLFSFSLHSNVDISVKWIGIVMKVVLF